MFEGDDRTEEDSDGDKAETPSLAHTTPKKARTDGGSTRVPTPTSAGGTLGLRRGRTFIKDDDSDDGTTIRLGGDAATTVFGSDDAEAGTGCVMLKYTEPLFNKTHVSCCVIELVF